MQWHYITIGKRKNFTGRVLAYEVVRVNLVREPVQVAEEDRRHELQPGAASARRAKCARQGDHRSTTTNCVKRL